MEGQPVVGEPSLSGQSGPVEEVVRSAHAELRQLLEQRAEVMRKIGTVKRTIAGLADIFGDSALSDEVLELIDRKAGGRRPGLTRSCRIVLMNAKRALSSREVCARLETEAPLLLQRHKDATASVTTVLNRLVAYGEASAVTLATGRRAWEWVTDTEPCAKEIG